MRGLYKRRVEWVHRDMHTTDSLSDIECAKLMWFAPLSADEIAAAKREGCAGCAWSAERIKDGYATLVCARMPQDVIVSGGSHWCSEWRQKPAADAGGGNP